AAGIESRSARGRAGQLAARGGQRKTLCRPTMGAAGKLDPVALATVSASELRGAIRRGEWTGPTAGLARGFVQANLVVLPAAVALSFAEFCRLNDRACPLLEQTGPGDFIPHATAPSADLRSDVPRYRVFRHGQAETVQPTDIRSLWRDDLVSFLLG